MKSLVSRLIKNESGATAIEYGLIAAGMAVVVVTIFSSDGAVFEMLDSLFSTVSSTVNSAATPPAPPAS